MKRVRAVTSHGCSFSDYLETQQHCISSIHQITQMEN